MIKSVFLFVEFLLTRYNPYDIILIIKRGDKMVTKRNIALCIVFSIITCGIYDLYWFVVLTDETNNVSNDNDGTSGGVALLLSIVTCGIYGLYWAYKQGEKLDKAKNDRGIQASNSGILYLILGLLGFGIIAYALMQDSLNKLAD